jgi:hypothetical protein
MRVTQKPHPELNKWKANKMNPYVSSRKLTNANSSEVSHISTQICRRAVLPACWKLCGDPILPSRIPEDGTAN